MFPEDDLRLRFWRFVAERALDQRAMGLDQPCGTDALNEIEFQRAVTSLREDLPGRKEYEPGYAVVYDTLQEALLAFLIYEVSLRGFTGDYATWLRTVTLILTQAMQQPDLLELRVRVDKEGTLIGASNDMEEQLLNGWTDRTFTMTLNGSWDCLSRDTFNTIRRLYERAG